MKILVGILMGFVIGFVSAFGALFGGGYYLITQVSVQDGANLAGQFSGGSVALPDEIPDAFLDMTILQILSQLGGIATGASGTSLNDLSETYGLDLAALFGTEEGTDFLPLIEPLLDIPLMSIPDNLNLLVDSISISTLSSMGVMDINALPNLPIFNDPTRLNDPIMQIFSQLASMRVADLIQIYYGDYYPYDNGAYVLSSGEYTLYDSENELHQYKNRYSLVYTEVDDEEGLTNLFVCIETGTGDDIIQTYFSYNEDNPEHEGLDRYIQSYAPFFFGNYVIVDGASPATYITYVEADHFGQQRYNIQEQSASVLIALAEAYLSEAPDSDPTGKTISETVNIMQINQILDIYEEDVYDGGTLIHEKSHKVLIALQDAYLNAVPTSDITGMTMSQKLNSLQLNAIMDIYEEDVYDGATLIHEKSNSVLIALQDAYIGATVPEGETGMTISQTIDTLTLGEVVEVTDTSPPLLIELQDVLINELDNSLNTLQLGDAVTIYTENIYDINGALIHPKSSNAIINLKDAYINEVPSGTSGVILSEAIDNLQLDQLVDIYDGTEYIVDALGIYYRIPATYVEAGAGVDDGYILKSDDCYYPETDYEGTETLYVVDTPAQYVEDGSAEFIAYGAGASSLPKFSLSTPSSKILVSLHESSINNLDTDMRALPLGELIDIYEEDVYEAGVLVQAKSSKPLIFLKDTTIDGINVKMLDMTFGDAVTVFTENIYNGDGTLLYEKSVKAMTELMDVNINTTGVGSLSDRLDTMLVEDLLEISETARKVVDPLGVYYRIPATYTEAGIGIVDGYILKGDGGYYPVTNYAGDETLYVVDTLAQYVEDGSPEFIAYGDTSLLPRFNDKESSRLMLAMARDDVTLDNLETALYDFSLDDILEIDSSSALVLQSLSDSSFNTLSADMDSLRVNQFIEIDSSSPMLLIAIQDAYINNVPGSDPTGMTIAQKINILQLKDMIDIKTANEYAEDDSGYFASVDEITYVVWETGNTYTRYTRTVSVDDSHNVYTYVTVSPIAGTHYALIIDSVTFEETYESYDPLVHTNGEPVYALTSNQALLSALKDAYLYEVPGTDPGGKTLEQAMNDLTIVDLLGEPDDGSLLEMICYYDYAAVSPEVPEDPVLLKDLGDRAEVVEGFLP